MEKNTSKSLMSFSDPSLDTSTITFLNQSTRQLMNVVSDSATQIGKILYDAQQKLASFHNNGAFAKWIEYIGFSRTSAYNYINRYVAVQNLDSSKEIQAFESLPKSLTYDISKPSADPELTKKVLNGDIKTHKEYKALEARLKQREQELSDKDAQIADQQAELEDNRKTQLELNNRLAESNKHQPEPKVITKTVTKEVPVKPDDYDELKANVARLQRQKDDAAKQLDEANEKLRDYEDIDKQNRKAEHWKSRGRLSVYQISSHITDFLAANTLLSEDKEAACDAGDEALASYDKKLDDLQKWIDDQRNITSGRRTVEGEIINEH